MAYAGCAEWRGRCLLVVKQLCGTIRQKKWCDYA